MAKKFFTLVLLLALGCSLTTTGFAKHKKSSTSSNVDFDYYLLTLSWAPEFCATNPSGRSSAECDPKKHMGLVVHGLWPQYNNGKWPQDCASTPPVSSATVNHMLPIMPGKQLIQHEWSKHGTCSGLSVDDYFAGIEKLYTGLTVPDDFKKPSETAQTNPGDIEAAFASANNAPKGAFRVSCPQNEFSAVEICQSKDLQYQACPTTVKECRAGQIRVRPVP
ncbi:MAG TPA: ribonuclease T2 [Dongiaceae bacterium]|nr:ribonuclease T2 [Dongiaceae bacterium]